MRAWLAISILGFSGILLAQVAVTPVNQGAVLLSSNTNAFDLSKATQIISGLKLGMPMTNVDIYLKAHGVTNVWGGSVSLDRGRHKTYIYSFPGTDRTLRLVGRSRPTGPDLCDWGDPVLESARIQRLGVDTFLIRFTNAP